MGNVRREGRRDAKTEQRAGQNRDLHPAARGVKHHHRTRVDQAVYRERDQASSPACLTVRPHEIIGMCVRRRRRYRRHAEHGNRR